MGCNCKWLEIIVAIVVFVLALWPLFGTMVSKWIVAIVAIVLFLHALMCKNCNNYGTKMDAMPARKASGRRKRR